MIDDANENKDNQNSIEEENTTEELPSDQAEIDVGKTAVAEDPKKNIAIGIIFAVLLGIGAYYFLSTGKSTKKSPKDSFPLEKKQVSQSKQNITAPQIDNSESITSTAAISPEAFMQQEEMLKDKNTKQNRKKIDNVDEPKSETNQKTAKIKNTTYPSDNLTPPQLKTSSTTTDAQRQQAKLKSSIMLSSGNTSSNQNNNTQSTSNKRSLSHNFHAEATTAASSQITKVGDMSLIITQGKILEAVLETPLNTNYPGPIRAVISRDIFSEQGENVLIPKGSRVIGEISGGYKPGQDRILIGWRRIILPTGYDIVVKNAEGVGKLGEVGISGNVHREFFNTIGNALLLSTINIGFAKAIEDGFKVKPSQETHTTGRDGTQTSSTTNSPSTQAAKEQVTNLGNITKGWVKDNFLTKPYITIDQGTIVKIFVNQDILFSNRNFSGVNIIK